MAEDPAQMDAAAAEEDLDVGSPAGRALARRILRFEQTMRSRLATTTVPLPFGSATLCPDHPLTYAASGLEVTRPAAVSEVMTAVDRTFGAAGLRHRRITTALPEVAWTLVPALADRGWQTERLVTMVHDGHTPSPVSPLGFDVVDHDTYAPVGRRFVAEADWGRDPAVQDDRTRWDRRLADRVGARFVVDSGGVAGCHLYRHGQVAQIESVNVLAEARGQGLGEGLMAAAMAACRDAAVVFLVADAVGWPQHWYHRLGFIPLAPGWDWILVPPEART